MASKKFWLLGAALQTAAAVAGAQGTDSDEARRLPRVTVSGHSPNADAEPASITEFGDAPLGRTPVSADIVDARDLRDNGIRSLSAMARGLPSVSDAYNTVGFIESLQVRGFALDSSSVLNYRRNGLPVSNYAPLALEDKDRIEILKGLNGALAGTSSPGGLVNYVTKRPGVASLHEVNAALSERGTWTIGADLSERAGPLGYRFNLATEERRPNARDAPGDRRFASGAVDLNLPRDGTFEFEVEWQRARQISVPGFGLLDRDGDGTADTLPPPIDPRINLNNQPWSQPFESHQVVGTARFEQALGPVWRLGVRALAQRILTNDRIAFPDGCSSGPNYVYPGLCGNYDVDLYDYRSDHEIRTTRSTEAYAIARFAGAGVRQRVQFGARATRYAERLPPMQAYNFVGTINVFDPVDLAPDPSLTVINTDRDLALDEGYLYDTLELGTVWTATIGARYVRVRTSSALTGGTEGVAFARNLVTPWAALGWQPWSGGFLYVSAGTGIEAEVVPNRAEFANAGQVLPVGRSRQVELGYKQALGETGSVDIAVFQIGKPYAENVDAAGKLLRVADARTVRHRGVEFAAVHALSRAASVDFKATYLDATVDRSLQAALVGNRVTNVPRFAARFGAALWPSPALDLQWRNAFEYSGTKAVTEDNSVVLPASWQWDTALIWAPSPAPPALQFIAGIDNVTNRRYWREAPTQPWGATYLFPAQPRTYRIALSARF
jgi:iron complex outermembrane recepter protein